MGIEAFCKTDKGLRRETNQDSFLLDKDLGLFIVADGMGGHQGGEVASATAVQSIKDFIANPPLQDLSPKDLLVAAYSEASRRIFDFAATEKPELTGMGTTMVMMMQKGPKIYIGNVGDSRAYLFRKPYIWQITDDHSLVMEQLRAGLINEDQVKSFSGRNVITRSVGYERDVMVDIVERPITKGDVFLLCSDGLSGLVVDQKICEILNSHQGEQAVDKCIAQALANGGDDNVTVMIVSIN